MWIFSDNIFMAVQLFFVSGVDTQSQTKINLIFCLSKMAAKIGTSFLVGVGVMIETTASLIL